MNRPVELQQSRQDNQPAREGPEAPVVAALKKAITKKLLYTVGKDPEHASVHDWYMATALAVRDRMVDRWVETTRRTYADGEKRVYYLSLEFLIGRLLIDSLTNLGLIATCRTALSALG